MVELRGVSEAILQAAIISFKEQKLSRILLQTSFAKQCDAAAGRLTIAPPQLDARLGADGFKRQTWSRNLQCQFSNRGTLNEALQLPGRKR